MRFLQIIILVTSFVQRTILLYYNALFKKNIKNITFKDFRDLKIKLNS